MSTDFGTDVSCVTDVDPRCAVVSGRRLLAEAVARRLITPRGRLIGDPNYGTDITDYINDDVSKTNLAAMRAAIIAEARKDERVEKCQVIITPPPARDMGIGKYLIAVTLTDADGPFDLTLAVNQLTLELLDVAA